MSTFGILLACTLCAIPVTGSKTNENSLRIRPCKTQADIVFVLDLSIDCNHFSQMTQVYVQFVKGFQRGHVKVAALGLWRYSVVEYIVYNPVDRLEGFFSRLIDQCRSGLYSSSPNNILNLRPRRAKKLIMIFMIKDDLSRYDDERLDKINTLVALGHNVHSLAIVLSSESDKVPLENETNILNVTSTFRIGDGPSLTTDVLPVLQTICSGDSFRMRTCITEADIIFVLDMSMDCSYLSQIAIIYSTLVTGFNQRYPGVAIVLIWRNCLELMPETFRADSFIGYFSDLEKICKRDLKCDIPLDKEKLADKGRRGGGIIIIFILRNDLSRYDDRRLDGIKNFVASNHNVRLLAIVFSPPKMKTNILNTTSVFRVRDSASQQTDVLLFLQTICPACEEGEGWRYYNGRCHRALSFRRDISWLEAQKSCQIRQSNLTTIRDSKEDAFLNTLVLESDTTYIGLTKQYHRNRVNKIFRWADSSLLTYTNWGLHGVDGGSLQRCFLKNVSEDKWTDVACGTTMSNTILCTRYALNASVEYGRSSLPEASSYDHDLFTNCANGELVSKFNFCDEKYDCRDRSDELHCGTSCSSTQFQCTEGGCVSFSFYCDGTRDCSDGSDEDCELGKCAAGKWTCASGQCIDKHKRCDLIENCYDKTDEAHCESSPCRNFKCHDGKCIPNSWVGDGVADCDGGSGEDEENNTLTNHLGAMRPESDERTSNASACVYNIDMQGKAVIHFPNDGNCSLVECDETHYKCPNSYCIPIQFVCNGLPDCPDAVDEENCDGYTCPGYFPCSKERYCIPPSQLCDGVRHCPLGDDERMCPGECPQLCTCSGRVIQCNFHSNEPYQFPKDVRKLDLSGMNLPSADVGAWDFQYLIILIMSSSNITRMEDFFPKLPNLLTLDISHNEIAHLVQDSFSSFPNLKQLDLSNNVNLSKIGNGSFTKVPKLEKLNLFNTRIMELKATTFQGLSNLRILNLSHSHIYSIDSGSFRSLKSLEYLDIRQNSILHFHQGIFDVLPSLKKLQADSYKLCCESVRPKSLTKYNCFSSKGTIASCEDLLGLDILRNLLWVIAVVAFVGNIMVIVYRLIYNRQSLLKSHGILVTNLSIADFFMGLYMIIIGCVDISFKGSYVWHDHEWRHSALCKFVGFLSMLSSEASCIFITLITFDRLMAVAFPFRKLAFSLKKAYVSTAITWTIAILLAGIPLLPPLKWSLYTQNSVCLALPFSDDRQPGWLYSATIYVGFNFVLFLVIGICQALIYRVVATSSKIRQRRDDDTTIAKRLLLVVLTDFLCWFPIGVLGIISLRGVPLDGKVYAWTAVTVLPVNSALNPVLYTAPSIVQAWRDARKKKERLSIAEPGTSNVRHPMDHIRVYVGVPAPFMETLGTTLQSRDVPPGTKCDLICLIIVFILDLHQQQRHLEPVSNKNIFVCRYKKDILKVCLSLESQPDHLNVSDDIVFLMQEVRKQCDPICEDQCEDIEIVNVTTDI